MTSPMHSPGEPSSAPAPAGSSPVDAASGSTELLKIGDFARLAETNLRTLRYYEELGLLVPASRSQGGFRYYRPTDLNRLRTIRDLQDLGLALEKIGELLATRDSASRSEWLAQVHAAITEQERLVAERIEELKARRDELAQARLRLSICAECTTRPCVENNFCEPCAQTGEPLPAAISALF